MALPAAVLSVLVNAHTGGAAANLTRLDKRLKGTASSAEVMGARVAKASKYAALGLAAGAAGSIYAAAKFESAFAEVRKTVDTNEKGFKRIEKGLRGLATQIPVSANELANLAGEAGALGIKSKDIVRFTKTAAMLGTTTDMASTDAANALARLSNIMDSRGRKSFQRMGATLVDLGNKGASTEDEIADMALRIAGAGKTLGLTEAEVLGLSSSLANVGIRAEMGGSAISRVMLQMQEAIAKGGPELQNFAEITGVSVSRFVREFGQNAPRAIALFAQGLGKVHKAGEPIISTLRGVELSEIRVRDTLLRIAGNTRQFTDAQNVANRAWKQNAALTNEARERYKTFESQLKLLGNQIVEVAISVGQKLMPVAKALVEVLQVPAVQNATLATLALAAAFGTATFIGIKLVAAFRALAVAAAVSRTAIMATFALISRHPLGALVVGIGLAAGALYTLARSSDKTLNAQQRLHQTLQRQREMFEGLAASSRRLDNARDRQRKAVEGVRAAEERLNNARRSYPARSQPVLDAEVALRKAKQESARASRAVRNAERLRGVELEAMKRILPSTVREQKAHVLELRNERRGYAEALRAALNMKRPLSEIIPLQRSLQGASKALDQGNRALNQTFIRAARLTNPAFARSLQEIASRMNALDPLARKTPRQLQAGFSRIVANATGMVNTTGEGLEVFGQNFASVGSGLGVKPLQYEIRRFQGERKQRGGHINTGKPSGDSVPAMLERGEYVLNRVAVAKVGKDKLDAINFGIASRFGKVGGFQRGGYAGVSGDTDFTPALGFALSKMAQATRNSIFVQSGGRTRAEQAALYAKYGPGRAAPPGSSHHEFSQGATAADITPGREVFGGPSGRFGMGFPLPHESWHIELLNAALGARGGGSPIIPRLARLLLSGPDGPLKALGQGAIDKVWRAGQAFLNKKASFGGLGGGGAWEAILQQIAASRGWSASDWMELVMRESGGNPAAVNPSSGAYGLGQFLGATKDAYAKYGAASPNGADQIRAMAKYISDRYGSPTAALAFHDAHNWYREGGLVGMQRGGVAGIGKAMATGKRKYPGIARQLKRIQALELPAAMSARLTDLSGQAERFSEYASNASSLTLDTGEGDPIQGIFKGAPEGEWLMKELGALGGLRNQLIQAHDAIVARREWVTAMIAQAETQLAAVRRAIQKAEERRRKLTTNLRTAQDALATAKKARNTAGIQRAVSTIFGLRDQIDTLDTQQRSRRGLLNRLKGQVLPALTGRRENINQTRGEILGQGGDKFMGLQAVQGLDGPMNIIANIGTTPGSFGGNILNAQLSLKALNERGTVGADSGLSEALELQKELTRQANQRAAISDAALPVLRDWDALRAQVGAPFGKFAGMFAGGGPIPAGMWGIAGERGPEIVQGPASVTPITSTAGAGGGPPTLIIEQLVIHEDGRATMTYDNQEVEAVVKRVIRDTPLGGRVTSGGMR